jgi:hypothetical protein
MHVSVGSIPARAYRWLARTAISAIGVSVALMILAGIQGPSGGGIGGGALSCGAATAALVYALALCARTRGSRSLAGCPSRTALNNLRVLFRRFRRQSVRSSGMILPCKGAPGWTGSCRTLR